MPLYRCRFPLANSCPFQNAHNYPRISDIFFLYFCCFGWIQTQTGFKAGRSFFFLSSCKTNLQNCMQALLQTSHHHIFFFKDLKLLVLFVHIFSSFLAFSAPAAPAAPSADPEGQPHCVTHDFHNQLSNYPSMESFDPKVLTWCAEGCQGCTVGCPGQRSASLLHHFQESACSCHRCLEALESLEVGTAIALEAVFDCKLPFNGMFWP